MRSFKRSCGSLALLLVPLLAAIGCDNPTTQVKVEMVGVPGSGASAMAAVYSRATSLGAEGLVRPWSSLLNISSLQIPVVGIELRSTGEYTITLYECPGATSDDCLVELVGPALEDLLDTDPVEARPATYDRVVVRYCNAASRNAYLAGSVVIGGSTYYTKTVGNLAASAPAQPVPLPYNGCQNEYPIFPPLIIDESSSLPILVRLYFDIRDIAYASTGDPTANPLYGFGCSHVATLGSTPFACAAYPTLSAVKGSEPPAVERYRVNGGATIGMMFQPTSGEFIGGYFRRYLVETEAWNPLFTPDSFVESFTATGGGSYQLRQVSGAYFPAFRRETHSGTAIGYNGISFAYTAVRLP